MSAHNGLRLRALGSVKSRRANVPQTNMIKVLEGAGFVSMGYEVIGHLRIDESAHL